MRLLRSRPWERERNDSCYVAMELTKSSPVHLDYSRQEHENDEHSSKWSTGYNLALCCQRITNREEKIVPAKNFINT